MTASRFPVYLLYPPDIHGRRPSEHTSMHYASPRDRAYQEWFRNEQNSLYEERFRPPNGHKNVQFPNQITYSNEPPAMPALPVRSSNRQIKQLYREHTFHTLRRPFTLVWYCCQRCFDGGPHSSLHTHCPSCNRVRCPACEERIIRV